MKERAGENCVGDDAGSTPIQPLFMELRPMKSVFPVKCNPNYPKVKEECEEWAMSLFSPPLSAHGRNAFLSINMSLITSLCTPSTLSPQRLLLITKFNNWLTYFDDVLDGVTAAAIMASIQAALYGEEADVEDPLRGLPQRESLSRAITKFRRDIWDEICRASTPQFVAHLAHDYRCCMACITGPERRYRSGQRSHIRSLNDFLELRRMTILMPVLFRLLEFGLELDTRFLRPAEGSLLQQEESFQLAVDADRALAELEMACARHALCVDDYYSFQAEFRRQDMVSVPGFLLQSGSSGDAIIGQLMAGEQAAVLRLQEVMQQTWEMIEDLESKMPPLLRRIQSFHDSLPPPSLPEMELGRNVSIYSQDMLRYATEMCIFTAGWMYWCTLTTRYNGKQS